MGTFAFSQPVLAAIALFCGLWLGIVLWLSLVWARRSQSNAADPAAGHASSLLGTGPAVPLLIHRDGDLEAPWRLGALLGADAVPTHLDQLLVGPLLTPQDGEAFAQAARNLAAGGGVASLLIRPQQAPVVLRVTGQAAPPPYPAGTLLFWFIDLTDEERERDESRAASDRLAYALDALSALIEAAPFPIWHRGPDLKLAMVNGAYVHAVESSDAMDVVDGGVELIEEEEEGEGLRHAALVRDSGRPITRTVPATLAGERRMLRVLEVPLASGGVAGYAIDVEEREQARAELARFVVAQRDMLDRLSAGVAQFGPDRSLIFYNHPFSGLFGLKAEFLSDRPEFDRLIDAMRTAGGLPEVRHFPEWKDERRRWFTSGEAQEEDWLLRGGKHLRVVAQPLPDGGLVLIFEDRTEQIQLASARDTLLRVRTATFDNLFEAIGVFASDGRLALWNNRFRLLWQFDEGQLSGNPRIDSLVPHIARQLKNPDHAVLVRELVRTATIERKQRSGRVSLIDGRDFEFAAVPLPDGNALFTMLDITDSRMIETALRERNEALEEADRLKTAFVSNMSYELRTPLTSIAGFAEMLAGGYAGELAPGAYDYVAAILASVERLSSLIDNVLDLTQSDSGSLLLAEEEVDLLALVQGAADAAFEAAQRKRLSFDTALDPNIGHVHGDRRRLRQALDNVLRNAVDYTPEGGTIVIAARAIADVAEILVTDTGSGISPLEQSRVFDRFHRATAPDSGERGSLGLGLPLAKQFVEAHGGRIELQSELGQGTTVTIRLPRTMQ